ncbi:MAG: hypothetical protein Q8919_08985, partial [Bacteroidota bacterium]|nr:hypothetical protein [Bacteroidota bacterium]
MIAIEFPENWKIVKAYAAEDGATESTPISQDEEFASYFEREKGHAIRVFEDRTRVYAENFEGIAYFFVFSSQNVTSTGNFKACYLERSDPSIPALKEPKKGKKLKPQGRLKNFEWRIVSPNLGANFSFSQVSGKRYSHAVKLMTGWSNTSRSLSLNGNLHASARLILRPELLRDFFDHSFTIRWWMRSVSGEQTIFKFLAADSLSGVSVNVNPFGQIDVRRFPSTNDSDVVILSNVTTCDGSWHHVALSDDASG